MDQGVVVACKCPLHSTNTNTRTENERYVYLHTFASCIMGTGYIRKCHVWRKPKFGSEQTGGRGVSVVVPFSGRSACRGVGMRRKENDRLHAHVPPTVDFPVRVTRCRCAMFV